MRGSIERNPRVSFEATVAERQEREDSFVENTDHLALLEGEELIACYDGMDCDCQERANTLIVKKDKIYLTDHRIITEETIKICGITVSEWHDFFQYKDLQHVAIKTDRRFRFLISSVLALYAQSWLIARDNGFVVLLGIVMLVVGSLLLLYFLMKFCTSAEIYLDFHKKEIVNNWSSSMVIDKELMPLRAKAVVYPPELYKLMNRCGSSVTKVLGIDPARKCDLIKDLIGHPLTQYEEDRRRLNEQAN